MPQNDIDITLLIEALAQAFKTWAVSFILSFIATIPGLGFLAWPIIGPLFGALVGWIIGILIQSAIMQAFFLHTAMVKMSYAKDFIDAVAEKNNLPPTASVEEFKNAETKQMACFRNLVLLRV